MIVKAEYRIIMGTISLSCGIVSAMLSGFNFYNPEPSVIWALISLGSTLVGIGLVKEFKSK